MFKELQKEIHEINVSKGFYEEEHSSGKIDVPKRLMLIVSELSEALEADRDSNYADSNDAEWAETLLETINTDAFKEFFKNKVKNTFEDEITDVQIRLLDLAEAMGIDLDKHVKLKLAYNKTRPHKHGRNY